MNISRENLGELELVIKIEIAENDYAERVAKQLKEYQKKATVPGFRKGMAPMGLIQRMYKSAIVADEVQSLLGESLYKYLEDEKLDIIGSPLSNEEKTGKVDFEHGKDFTFYFDAALMPQVELAWDKVNAPLYQIKINPKDIDRQVEDVCKRYGSFETPETVGEGDFVYGKIEELDKNGEVKEGGVSTFTSFDLGTVKNSEEIVPLFVGKKAEEQVVFNAGKAFTAADIEKNLRIDAAAAKKFKSDVRFTISGCSHITPHEINDELYAKVFPNEKVKDAAAFRKLLGKELEKSYNEQADILYVNEVRKQLIDNFTATMPEAFLKRWILNRGEKDMTAETLEAEWAEKYVPSLKWEMVDSALNKIKPIEPTQNDIVDYVKDILRQNDTLQEGEDAEAQDKRLEQSARTIAKDRQNVQQIVDRLSAKNTCALFKEQLKPEAEKVTIKEFAEKVK
ncbi:MAG: trigger factor [Bacteroidales bacterium]|nr:trigger factor [Bacteroidales bacterium]